MGPDYEEEENYHVSLSSVYKRMLDELRISGRREPNFAQTWWYNIENSSVKELRKNKLYGAPIFIDCARAFLSIQASSAPAERLFSDAGFQEGARRQIEESCMTEMLLFVRNFVSKRLSDPSTQRGFISGPANAMRQAAEEIAHHMLSRTK